MSTELIFVAVFCFWGTGLSAYYYSYTYPPYYGPYVPYRKEIPTNERLPGDNPYSSETMGIDSSSVTTQQQLSMRPPQNEMYQLSAMQQPNSIYQQSPHHQQQPPMQQQPYVQNQIPQYQMPDQNSPAQQPVSMQQQNPIPQQNNYQQQNQLQQQSAPIPLQQSEVSLNQWLKPSNMYAPMQEKVPHQPPFSWQGTSNQKPSTMLNLVENDNNIVMKEPSTMQVPLISHLSGPVSLNIGSDQKLHVVNTENLQIFGRKVGKLHPGSPPKSSIVDPTPYLGFESGNPPKDYLPDLKNRANEFALEKQLHDDINEIQLEIIQLIRKLENLKQKLYTLNPSKVIDSYYNNNNNYDNINPDINGQALTQLITRPSAVQDNSNLDRHSPTPNQVITGNVRYGPNGQMLIDLQPTSETMDNQPMYPNDNHDDNYEMAVQKQFNSITQHNPLFGDYPYRTSKNLYDMNHQYPEEQPRIDGLAPQNPFIGIGKFAPSYAANTHGRPYNITQPISHGSQPFNGQSTNQEQQKPWYGNQQQLPAINGGQDNKYTPTTYVPGINNYGSNNQNTPSGPGQNEQGFDYLANDPNTNNQGQPPPSPATQTNEPDNKNQEQGSPTRWYGIPVKPPVGSVQYTPAHNYNTGTYPNSVPQPQQHTPSKLGGQNSNSGHQNLPFANGSPNTYENNNQYTALTPASYSTSGQPSISGTYPYAPTGHGQPPSMNNVNNAYNNGGTNNQYVPSSQGQQVNAYKNPVGNQGYENNKYTAPSPSAYGPSASDVNKVISSGQKPFWTNGQKYPTYIIDRYNQKPNNYGGHNHGTHSGPGHNNDAVPNTENGYFPIYGNQQHNQGLSNFEGNKPTTPTSLKPTAPTHSTGFNNNNYHNLTSGRLPSHGNMPISHDTGGGSTSSYGQAPTYGNGQNNINLPNTQNTKFPPYGNQANNLGQNIQDNSGLTSLGTPTVAVVTAPPYITADNTPKPYHGNQHNNQTPNKYESNSPSLPSNIAQPEFTLYGTIQNNPGMNAPGGQMYIPKYQGQQSNFGEHPTAYAQNPVSHPAPDTLQYNHKPSNNGGNTGLGINKKPSQAPSSFGLQPNVYSQNAMKPNSPYGNQGQNFIQRLPTSSTLQPTYGNNQYNPGQNNYGENFHGAVSNPNQQSPNNNAQFQNAVKPTYIPTHGNQLHNQAQNTNGNNLQGFPSGVGQTAPASNVNQPSLPLYGNQQYTKPGINQGTPNGQGQQIESFDGIANNQYPQSNVGQQSPHYGVTGAQRPITGSQSNPSQPSDYSSSVYAQTPSNPTAYGSTSNHVTMPISTTGPFTQYIEKDLDQNESDYGIPTSAPVNEALAKSAPEEKPDNSAEGCILK